MVEVSQHRTVELSVVIYATCGVVVVMSFVFHAALLRIASALEILAGVK